MAARRELMALGREQQHALGHASRRSRRPTAGPYVDIDREKASALGLSVADVNDNAADPRSGSTYVNNYVDTGRIQKSTLQADAPYRMMPADIGRW